jgi:hypothetical protein
MFSATRVGNGVNDKNLRPVWLCSEESEARVWFPRQDGRGERKNGAVAHALQSGLSAACLAREAPWSAKRQLNAVPLWLWSRAVRPIEELCLTPAAKRRTISKNFICRDSHSWISMRIPLGGGLEWRRRPWKPDKRIECCTAVKPSNSSDGVKRPTGPGWRNRPAPKN